MTTSTQVLQMLIPLGGWATIGNDYEGIQFLECEPITKQEFEAGFAQYDAYIVDQAAQAVAADKVVTDAKASRDAKLAKMGFSAVEIENW